MLKLDTRYFCYRLRYGFRDWQGDRQSDRPISQVPNWVKLGLVLMLLVQLYWHAMQASISVQVEALQRPDSVQTYQLISLNEPLAMAKYLNL